MNEKELRMLISLIIPVFNGEKYLNSFRSNISKIYADNRFEIIVINDGSTDVFHKKLLQEFPKIKYHYQSNQGSGIARNAGIEIATHDWIMFMDVDDEIDKQVLDIALSFVKKPVDIYCFQAKRILHSKNIKEKLWKPEVFKHEYTGPAFGLPNIVIDSIVMNKIFSRDFLLQSKVKFPKGKYEDKIFLTELFLRNPQICISKLCYYKWMVFPNSGSQTNTKNVEDINQRFDTCERQLLLAKNTPYFDIILSNIFNHDVALYSYNFKSHSNELKEKLFERLSEFKKYKKIKQLTRHGHLIYESIDYKQLCHTMDKIDKNKPFNIIKMDLTRYYKKLRKKLVKNYKPHP